MKWDFSAWTRLPSGAEIDILNPNPVWEDGDIAIRLSRTLRWSGESKWDLPLSVAQHSLAVLALAREHNPALTKGEALRELLHDADEAFLGFDAISPLKAALGPQLKVIGDRLSTVVAERYKLPAWTPASYASHKRADITVAASEAFHVVGWPVQAIDNKLKIEHQILDEDPLAPYGFEPWKPWCPKVAEEIFLRELNALKS